ncbi:MAG: cytochrome c [Sulfuricella sp.]|nr:cytochrome c [Sulfuricella sp.]
MNSHLRVVVIVAVLVQLSGCEKAMRNMYEQPKYKPLAASALWPDGQSARPLEPGVVAHGAGVPAAASSGRRGELPAASVKPPVTLETLRRGRERFDIYCAPCHSVAGDGDGMVVRRGFPRPRSLHAEPLRRAPDAQLFDAITAGYGAMYPFADRIAVPDRWAIVAYLRALQLSQHARLGDVPAAERNELK